MAKRTAKPAPANSITNDDPMSPWITGKRTVDDRTRSRLDTLANRLIVAAGTLKLGADDGAGEGVDGHVAHALYRMIDNVAANLIDICGEAREAEEAARTAKKG